MSPEARLVLERARARIDTPEKWAKGWYAFAANGDRRWAGEAGAERFCCIGAIGREVDDVQRYEEAMTAIRDAAPCENVARWNDAPERTHAEVMAAFDKALSTPSRGATEGT